MREYAIVPRPESIQYQPGVFECSGLPQIAGGVADFSGEIKVFTGQLQHLCDEGNVVGVAVDEAAATNPAAGDSSPAPGMIVLQKAERMAEEAYRLEILPAEIRLYAATGTGIYRGLQTLRQLLLSNYAEGRAAIPCGVIEDRPRFPWRGFMLDCSRYFYTVDFIKHLLDALSLQHVNVFHWHLTDDQGWRLPVGKYPLLCEVGSKRRDRRYSYHDKYIGGFYTEAEIRAVVAFAAERHIEVVPEVDLPGHASAILAAYPSLGCTGGPYQVEDRFGIFEDVLCAGNDGIFPLAEAVFDTLASLFPSQYVHIGGDEVRFNRWEQCPRCQRRMAELGLSKPAQLQSWITARLAEMLRQRGKTAIGWDEVLEACEQFPLPGDLVVMSWRGQAAGSHAAAKGHRVIMTPKTNGCYLDYKHLDQPEEPGQLNISTVAQGYRMEPITPEMDTVAAALVLGGQGNLWSEIIYAGKIAEYMIFPRICAIAETLWSASQPKDIEDFRQRLSVHQRRLDRLGLLQYRGEME